MLTKEDIFDYIPYEMEDSVSIMKEFSPSKEIFQNLKKKTGYPSKILFKGIPALSLSEIEKDQRLLIEKGHGYGFYGGGIYLADDIICAASYGEIILVVEVLDCFYDHCCKVKKDRYLSSESISGEEYFGLLADDIGTDTHPNEYVITNNDAMLLHFALKINKKNTYLC